MPRTQALRGQKPGQRPVGLKCGRREEMLSEAGEESRLERELGGPSEDVGFYRKVTRKL